MILLALAFSAIAGDLPRAKPEDVGLSSQRLDRITEVLDAKIKEGEIPGYVALVARRGKIAYFNSHGVQNPEEYGKYKHPSHPFTTSSPGRKRRGVRQLTGPRC